jgi:hypothetical protein
LVVYDCFLWQLVAGYSFSVGFTLCLVVSPPANVLWWWLVWWWQKAAVTDIRSRAAWLRLFRIAKETEEPTMTREPHPYFRGEILIKLESYFS